MSDTISTPAPADTAGADAASAPPATSQTPISISDAARLLNQQRRQPRQDAPQAREAAPQPTPANGEAAPPAASTGPARDTGDAALDSLAKALGLPDGAPPDHAPAPGIGSIEVDGRAVSADEVRRAMSMASDYTRKTQALAEQTRQLEAQQSALATVLPYLQPELGRLQQQIAGVPRPDPSLIETNHQEYLRQLANYQFAQDEQARLGQLQTMQQQAAERTMAEQVARSNEELSKQFPDWADPQKRAALQRRIVDWATERGGFQQAELSRLTDHRQLTVMMKAMMWDRMASGARTQAPVYAPPARGTAPPPAPAERVSAAEQAFDNRPNIRNAAQLLTARRNGSR